MRVLVIDDEAMVCALISMILEDAGYEVSTASSAEDALMLIIEGAEFDLIISDLNMPGINGIELFNKLVQVGCDWPFVLLSGNDPQKLREMAPGLTDCLMKDDTLEGTLVPVIERIMATRKPIS